MKKNIFKSISLAVIIAAGLVSCKKDLDRTPTNAITADQAYSTPLGYKQALAKVYGAYALTSSTAPDASDLGGIDAGTSDFLRLWWNTQELTTDNAINAWGDVDLTSFHHLNFSSTNTQLNGLYNRCIYQITVANAFIRESADDKLASRGITGTDATNVQHYRAEARFLRAFQYWVLMDTFGNPPFVDENTPVADKSYFPAQITRANLFAYIESELKAIDGLLVAPKQNEYGRADQAADWALLARIYLNAEVYLGSGNGKYTDAITNANKVIGAGYTLAPNYATLFLANNNLNNPEVILPINYDGVSTQNYGGTTYLINASINGAMSPTSYGVPNGGWGGNRSTKNLPLIFADRSGNTDKRAMFFNSTLDITNETDFTQGLAVTKFKNVTSAGVTPASSNGVFCSTDFPLFRLAEMYLINAEATLRGGTGNALSPAQDINLLRARAYGNASGNVTTASLRDVLNERQKELYWEGCRRTDLIRYGLFTTAAYVWPWKGGSRDGAAVNTNFNLFPIPTSDITNNPNLTQNPGY
ncbi:MAG: RagB/SusD family nutrient uptake outer membrane protein [Sphingobacteriaceae bacterium]|nr:MAG: RagB/SusD family nutrient uptake outer membrane protein [Sphingobacteriaceae bacterium]